MHPTPDLAALTVGTVVTLEYEQFGWAGSQKVFRLSTGPTLLAGAVSGNGEIEPLAPFGLEDGALTCEPECALCSMIEHRSARITLDGLSADIPARTHAQLGAYDVWIAAHDSPTSPVECTDTSGGYTLIGVVRR
ncbi:hypothetical protein OV203_33835 [Nannocystis sp. ILAH1]|uniref:hypothetical protein n=1 Tax=unclassified Nannocystis TaxID=2627009 RepID=UPI002271E286|nr:MULTISPECIES: hypothetical protein [unclassified Nannocystis]MCY0992168.1 hypothetical protein [Nannocystis sp. ILAH1]MCY1064388.1 hypothetical protein [Nannocystis sp. RBIL2]